LVEGQGWRDGGGGGVKVQGTVGIVFCDVGRMRERVVAARRRLDRSLLVSSTVRSSAIPEAAAESARIVLRAERMNMAAASWRWMPGRSRNSGRSGTEAGWSGDAGSRSIWSRARSCAVGRASGGAGCCGLSMVVPLP
jgi:hypothetical protein